MGAISQADVQQSPSLTLPSSQVSSPSTMPLPHRASVVVVEVVVDVVAEDVVVDAVVVVVVVADVDVVDVFVVAVVLVLVADVVVDVEVGHSAPSAGVHV